MAEQLDTQGGEQLYCKIEQMGVRVHTGKNTQQIVHHASGGKTLAFADGSTLWMSISSSSQPVFV